MMFVPSQLVTPPTDPVMPYRIGRPASRFEIAQRNHRYNRVFGPFQIEEPVTPKPSGTRGQDRFDVASGVRQSIARMLVRAGERLDPRLA